MGRPTLASVRVATADRLLLAAEQVFAAKGLERARLADIARLAGITRASLLYHFETKDELHAAVVRRALGSLGEILSSAMQADGPFAPRMEAILEGFFTFVQVHPSLARILVREVVDGHTQLIALVKPLLDDVVRFVEENHPEPSQARTARSALMMVISDAFLRNAHDEISLQLWGPDDSQRQLAWRLLMPSRNP